MNMNLTFRNMRVESASTEVGASHEGITEPRNEVAEPPTTERVFNLAVRLFSELGYECLSEDKIEDFTERIDGVLTKRGNSDDGNSSGYFRILSVYRSGQKIHVELYNFLKKFPADELEMKKATESLTKLFEKDVSVKIDIHE
jgi:hypothetical protein